MTFYSMFYLIICIISCILGVATVGYGIKILVDTFKNTKTNRNSKQVILKD